MLCTTKGIVLHSIPYKDTYSIIYMYTESFGRSSYMVSRRTGKKTSVSRSLFMPLSVLDLEVEHLNKRDIHKIKEARIAYPMNSILYDPVKNVLALFIAEVLFRAVKDTQPDERLFRFLSDSILLLDSVERGVANFHIVFLIHLLHYLGIYPNTEDRREGTYFDMMNGVFVMQQPSHPYFLSPSETKVMSRLLKITYENMSLYSFSRQDRVLIIQRLFDYYRLHLPDFAEIRSLQVLQALFD